MRRAIALAVLAAIAPASAGTPGFMLPGGLFTNGSSCRTTWNPNDAASGITLSNSNLTFAVSASGNMVRATSAKSSGKWYWETKIPSLLGIGLSVGFATSSTALSTSLGSDLGNTSIGWRSDGGVYASAVAICPASGMGGTGGGSGSGPSGGGGGCTVNAASYGSANDVIGFAVDLTNHLLYVSLNGAWQYSANPSAGTNGITIAAGTYYAAASSWPGQYQNLSGPSSGIGDFGATTFSYTPPTGFSPWC